MVDALAQQGTERFPQRDLRRFPQFYRTYPRIRESATAESANGDVLDKLSFTHLAEMIQIEAAKRAFYETECMRGVWSVREFKLLARYQFVDGEADVLGNLAQQDRRNVAPSVERHRGAASLAIPELFVRATLADFDKAQPNQQGDNLLGFEYRRLAHASGNGHVLYADELRFHHRLAVFQQHGDDFAQIVVDLIQRFALRMGTGKSWHETSEQAGLRTTFDHRRINSHHGLHWKSMRRLSSAG